MQTFFLRRGQWQQPAVGFVAVDAKGQRLALGSTKERFFLIHYPLSE